MLGLCNPLSLGRMRKRTSLLTNSCFVLEVFQDACATNPTVMLLLKAWRAASVGVPRAQIYPGQMVSTLAECTWRHWLDVLWRFVWAPALVLCTCNSEPILSELSGFQMKSPEPILSQTISGPCTCWRKKGCTLCC